MSEKVSLEIEVAAAQAQAEIRGTAKEMKGLAAEAKALAPSTNEVKATLAGLSQELKANSQMAKLFGTSSEGLQAQQRAIKNAAQDLIRQGLSPQSNELQELKNKYQSTSRELKEFEDNQKRAGNETANLSEKFNDLAQSGMALMALNKMKDFGVTAVNAFAQAESSAARLDTALELRGMQSSRKALNELAASIQRLTGEDGDLVTQLEAEMVAQGKNEAQIQNVIKASLGLSAVTGDDLSTSVQKLNATYAGVEGQMGKLIPELKNLTDEQLKAGAGVDLILDKYSAFIGKTGDTQIALKRAKESIDDVVESVGEGLSPMVNEAAILISGLASAIAGLSPEVKILGAIILTIVLGAMTGLVIRTLAVTAAKWGLFGAEMAVNAAMAVGNPLLWVGIAAATAAVVATGLLIAAKTREANATQQSTDANKKYIDSARTAIDVVNEMIATMGLFSGKKMPSFRAIDKQDMKELTEYISMTKYSLQIAQNALARGTKTDKAGNSVLMSSSAKTAQEDIALLTPALEQAENRFATLYKNGMLEIKGITDGALTDLQKVQAQINSVSAFTPTNDADKSAQKSALDILVKKRAELRNASQAAFEDFSKSLSVDGISLAAQKTQALSDAADQYAANMKKVDELGGEAYGATQGDIMAAKLKALKVYEAAKLKAEQDFGFKEREIAVSLTDSQIDDLELQRDKALSTFAGTEEQKAALAEQWRKKISQAEIEESDKVAAEKLAAMKAAFESEKKLAAESGNWGAYAGAEFQSQAANTDAGAMIGLAGQGSTDPMQYLIAAAVELALSFDSIKGVLNFVKTFAAMLKPILDPLLGDALMPIFDLLLELATPLTQILAPVISLVALFIRLYLALNPQLMLIKFAASILGAGLVWLNDKVIVPFGNGVIGVVNGLIRGVNGFIDGINGFLDKIGLGKLKIAFRLTEIALLQTTAQFAAAATAQETINKGLDAVRDAFQAKTAALEKAYDENVGALSNLLELGVISESEYAARVTGYNNDLKTQKEALEAAQNNQIDRINALSKALEDGRISVASALASLASILAEAGVTVSGPTYDVGAYEIPATQTATLHKGELVMTPSISQSIRSGKLTLGGPGKNGSNTTIYNVSVKVEGSISKEDDLADTIASKVARRIKRGQYEEVEQ